MSQHENTLLLEIASEHIDYWAGEGIGAVIENDVANNDLDALGAHLKESAKLMFDFYYQNDDPMTDERAEAMFKEAKNVY